MYYEKHILSGSQSIKNKFHYYRIRRVEIFFLGNNNNHHNSNGNDNIFWNDYDDVYDLIWMNNLKKMMMKKNQKSVKNAMIVLNETSVRQSQMNESSYICII